MKNSKLYLMLPVLFWLFFAYSSQAQDNALKLDGTNDYVDCGTVNLSLSAFTLETWVRPSIFAASGDEAGISGIMGIEGNGGTALIRLVENKPEFVVKKGATEYKVTSNAQLPLNSWFHIACTYDGTALKMYLNGHLYGSTSLTGAITATDVFYLGYSLNINRVLGGTLDESRVWNVARTQTQIADNMWNELSLPQTGLMAYYKYNQSSGTSLTDATGNYNGSLENMAGTEWRLSTKALTPGNSLYFDGPAQYVTFPSDAAENFNAFTAEAWVYPQSTGDCKVIGKTDENAFHNGFLIGVNELKLQVEIFNASSTYSAFSEVLFTENRWSHLAVSWTSGGEAIGYINGAEVLRFNTFSGTICTDDHFGVIGASANDGQSNRFKGLIDEVRLWNDVRSQEEILANMHAGLNGNEANLALYYNFDDVGISTVADITGSGNDGTMYNMSDADWKRSESFTTWIGNGSTNWETATNWTLEAAPDAERNVYIPTSSTYPGMGGSGMAARNLYLDANQSLSLSGDLDLYGNLMLNSDLDLNGHDITMSTVSSLVEYSGTLGTSGTGSISSSRSLTTSLTSDGYNLANLGFEITESANALGTTEIQRVYKTSGFKRYFYVNASSDPASATVVFHYDDSDLNGLSEDALQLTTSTDGTTWSFTSGSVVDTDANTITLTGVTDLSGIYFSASTMYSGGAGTEASPFLIATENDLLTLSNTSSDWNKYFLQTAHISFNDDETQVDWNLDGTADGSGTTGFIPIGNTTTKFTGQYDGGDFSISNLYINSSTSNSGLFGYALNATLQNVILSDVSIHVTNTWRTGALCGWAWATTITDCTSSGTVSGDPTNTEYIGGLVGMLMGTSAESLGSIASSTSSCTTSGYKYIGGLLGYINSTSLINYCSGSGDVNGVTFVGGLIGYAQGQSGVLAVVKNSFSTGDVSTSSDLAGGLIGNSTYANISNCYSRGDVTRTAGSNTQTASFIGYCAYSNVTHCFTSGAVTYNDATVNTRGSYGTLISSTNIGNYFDTETTGQTSGNAWEGKTTAEMKIPTTFTDHIYEVYRWDFIGETANGTDDEWGMHPDYNDGYPNLQGENTTYSWTWTGATSNDWNTAGNWATNIVPTSSNDVIIANAGTAPVIAGGETADCNNLTINSGATLTVAHGGSLMTAGTVTNNGTFNMELTMVDNHWHLISSPVAGATASVFENDYLQSFDETDQQYDEITDGSTPLIACEGYAASHWSKSSHTFSGTPNNGPQSIQTIVNSSNYSFNLVGNPYPSAIDWAILDNTYGSVYTFVDNGVNSGWTNWINGSGTNGGTQYIAPMQGFFLSVPGGEVLNFDNSHRTHTGANGFVKSKTELHQYVKLVATTENKRDETVIQFGDDFSESFELAYDAWKMGSESDEYFMLFSKCIDGNLAIDRRPETNSIQMGFKSPESTAASISIVETADLSTIELEDTKLSIFHDLSKGAYSFDWNTTDSEERFILHLKATGIENMEAQQAQVYATNGSIYVGQNESGTYDQMHVYDLAGRVIGSYSLAPESLQSIQLNQPKGTYLVQLVGDSQSQTVKIVF